MKITTPILLFILLFLSINDVRAFEENEKRPISHDWHIGGFVHRGQVMKHSHLVTPIIERSTTGGEIFLSKQTYGRYDWNSFFNYPEYGISYRFSDLGSPNYTGNAHALIPYLNFHLLNNINRVNMNFRLGMGLAYAEKIYDAETNPLNYALSTHTNIAIDAQLQLVCKMSKTLSLIAGAGIFHLSNGAYTMPNIGINDVSFFSGVSKSFGRENWFISPRNKINEKNKNWDCSFYILGGIKEINPIGGKKYFAGDFNLELTKKHLEYTRYGLSLDITHDGSEYDCIIFQSLPEVERFKTTRVGISGGYEWLFGDFAFDLFFGTYLYEPNPLYGRVYQRTSLRYPLSDRVKLSVAFRNHKGKADFIGVGLGFRLTN